MFIRSERLFLRPGWPEDWSDLATRLADPTIVRNLASAPWPYLSNGRKGFLTSEKDPRSPRFVVTLPNSGGSETIGCTGFAPGDAGIELGYWIARPFWGRGYATEAARAALSLARTLGHRQVVASQFADDPASAKVLAKLGFKPTGREVMRYSVGRGAKALARTWEIDLVAPCGDDDPAMEMANCAA